MNAAFKIRLAAPGDTPTLHELIHASVRGLQSHDYSHAQLEAALDTVYGVDSQLIADGTYFAVESLAPPNEPLIVGCGGWSKRKTLYGGDIWTAREDTLLDPRTSAAKIRAFFVHPAWARHGIGALILDACESAAKSAGFSRLEMGATLTGVPFYQAKGYMPLESLEVPLRGGLSLPIIRMAKEI
jgi:GNAT superfamily N-acetyltransferase